ncbi:MAG TPA: hypothetical protein VK623_02255 [Flavobacterium sp.]|nr:hypothetical protein [Flavobacterium sp.]
MKTIYNLRFLLMAFAALLMMSCATGFKGSSSDRTGTNGSTNGNGKTQTTTAHKVNY